MSLIAPDTTSYNWVLYGFLLSPASLVQRAALVRASNAVLAGDPHLEGVVPLDPTSDDALIGAVPDGIFLAKLVLAVEEDALDVRALNLGALTSELRLQNHTLCSNAATSIGCGVRGLQPQQLTDAANQKQPALQLIWNLAR